MYITMFYLAKSRHSVQITKNSHHEEVHFLGNQEQREYRVNMYTYLFCFYYLFYNYFFAINRFYFY